MTVDQVNAAINLRLALIGLPVPNASDDAAESLVAPILARQRELGRRLVNRLCPVDQRVQDFLDSYLADTEVQPELPPSTLILDEAGLARGLSLPRVGDAFSSPLLSSYRLLNGVLHNPANDRRTTQGVFHVVEGGSDIPDDKLAVPKQAFARLLERAFEAPAEATLLPYTANEDSPAHAYVSLLLRPLVVPAVPGVTGEKRMEIRFIAPGGLVSNLDFVEGIFGNAGDPNLPENDAALAPQGWTGTTGMVILAPHLTAVTKRELGLPHRDQATERQRRDGMCWTDESERYNDGKAFKVCARDARGVIVTIIADNYYGYCKKEVKTQISYSANLFGNVEEEHSGGAQVYPSYNLGQIYTDDSAGSSSSLADVVARDPERFRLQPEGYALDVKEPQVVLVPANSTYSLRDQTVSWRTADGTKQSIHIRARRVYIGPNGYRVHLARNETDQTQWSLIGTAPRSTQCHKPATVSGGGKSEISKAISAAFIIGNVYSPAYESDMAAVAEILEHDCSDRFADPAAQTDKRRILSDKRSIGSVIKLLTPSETDYTPEYNAWLNSIPPHILELVYVVKRFYRPEWKDDWKSHFSVGIMNGRLGNFLRLDGDKISVNMLRVGFEPDGSWRLFGLRHDFNPAAKVQTEDDITASTVACPGGDGLSRKYVENCEELLFQRPDDAVIRGYDKQAERDVSSPGTFLSNFQPLTHADAREMADDAVAFSAFSTPMQDLILQAAGMPDDASPEYFVSSADSRLVNGKRSKNPRYLQVRPDRANPFETGIADLCEHLYHGLPVDEPLKPPVDVVAAGRRNNPPDKGVPPLCSYNPLHYMELPELFMEFISSMTGKSPSTTGAGSEGAMTKGPFNAMPAIVDLNAALLSFILTGYDGWLSAAGFVGPNVRVDHDVSLLVPELFSRMTDEERSATNLVAEGMLEPVPDFTYEGETCAASRLGYRMTAAFARKYFGRIFLHPHVVFTEAMLKPELQDPALYAESVKTIVETHQRVARAYFDDGTIDLATPPLRALLEIMANGETADGLGLAAPAFRRLFDRDTVLAADWYRERLDAKQDRDALLLEEGIARIRQFLGVPSNAEATERLRLPERLAAAEEELARVRSGGYRASLIGTLGLQPSLR
ncbi:hypothetical protein [Propionicicella superfundia]|uniref:hypothetical protein n=1 Tax=Propionicicella superfundia TaxID=348582 RepID=UPI0004907170|nr:hypothetical protein [Propionicicella superfundia]